MPIRLALLRHAQCERALTLFLFILILLLGVLFLLILLFV